ncbi:MAG: UDP-N-acetylmuramate--L-alanine ligase [Planctomycetes bacterium RIFCSPLOWO2_12_FULL_39_13]|nr:MAG: UDP-N-acetylmuramate--L-alanine ligase [Planctomycetes bacterium RIFCSPLOWO2_12_FULL_39_13]
MNLISQEYYQGISNQHCQNLIDDSNGYGKYIYFIGIGGAGMSAVAKILINEGYIVSGSDTECSPVTHELGELGIGINTEQDGQGLDPGTNLVIISAAINENNPDLIKARSLGLRVVKYSEFLGSLMKRKCGIAVSGTHGKTTTTAMIYTILKNTGHEPSFVIGGNVAEIGGNSCVGRGSYFVAEACEYDRTFLNLMPQIGVITNIEEDHMDYYKDIDGITNAFTEFVSLIPKDGLLVMNNDDTNIRKVVGGAKCRVESYSVTTASDLLHKAIPIQKTSTLRTYSGRFPMNDDPYDKVYLESGAQWLAVVYYSDKEISHFIVFKEGKYFGDFCLKTPGLHNVSNALAAISVCSYIGLNGKIVKKALAAFNGVSRRFQTISSKNGITIIDDFAHHPTEIRTTLKTARSIYPSQRIWCVFQPHQYNRTKLLLKEFALALTLADKVIIADIYAARDSDIERASVSSLDLKRELQERGGDVECIKNISEIVNSLCLNVKRDDIIMILGAGDIWKAAYGLKNYLENGHD